MTDIPMEEPFYFQNKYLYSNQWYFENFPLEWAVCQKDGTGPGQCENCDKCGAIDGVFIGYCFDCAQTVYNGERGRGFIDVGLEADDPKHPSVFDTYLHGVNIYEIHSIEKDICSAEPEFDFELVYDYEPVDDSIFCCHFEGGYNDM